jgi:parvulin-like peptidyl-prolyl isomerase
MTSKKQEFITNLEKDSKIATEAVKETSAMLIQKLVKSYLSKNTFTELDHGTKLPKLFSLFNRIKAQIYRGKILQLDELIHAKTKEKNILNSRLAKLIKKIVITDQEIEKASKKGSSDGTISIESAEYISKILKPHIDKYFKNGRHLEAIIESCKTQGLDHIDILKIIRDCSQLKEEFNKNKTLENYESLIEAKKNFLNMTNLNTMMIDLNKEIDIIEQQLEELAKYSLYQQLGLMETNGFKEFTTSEKFTAFINTFINRAREKEKIDKELAINIFY